MKMADNDFEISEDKDIKAHPPETSRNLKRKLEELKTQRTPLVKRKRQLYEERARTLREMSEIETKLKKLEEEAEEVEKKIKEQDKEIEKAFRKIDDMDSRVSSNKVAIDELKKSQGSGTETTMTVPAAYKEAVMQKKAQTREDRKTIPEANMYVEERIMTEMKVNGKIADIINTFDGYANQKTPIIKKDEIKEWVGNLVRLIEITPIPRQWWDEEEKWLKECNNYDKDNLKNRCNINNKSRKGTCLSKFIWELKGANIQYKITWKILKKCPSFTYRDLEKKLENR